MFSSSYSSSEPTLLQNGEETFLSLVRNPAFAQYMGDARHLSEEDLRSLFALAICAQKQVQALAEESRSLEEQVHTAITEWDSQRRSGLIEISGSLFPVAGGK